MPRSPFNHWKHPDDIDPFEIEDAQALHALNKLKGLAPLAPQKDDRRYIPYTDRKAHVRLYRGYRDFLEKLGPRRADGIYRKIFCRDLYDDELTRKQQKILNDLGRIAFFYLWSTIDFDRDKRISSRKKQKTKR